MGHRTRLSGRPVYRCVVVKLDPFYRFSWVLQVHPFDARPFRSCVDADVQEKALLWERSGMPYVCGGWHPGHLPMECLCGKHFTVDHTLSCPCGGFLSLRRNEIRDVTADLLNELCHNVSAEPELQPLSGELLNHRTANTEDGARLDVKGAQGFWGDWRQCAFLCMNF